LSKDGRKARMISMSGFELSSLRQNAVSSQIAATQLMPLMLR
jgi:hypothetical protein